jgi:hypothetical protein
VIRSLATNIPKITWLNWRKVISQKEAYCFVKVLKSLSWASRVRFLGDTSTLPEKPYFVGSFLAKGVHGKNH